MTRMYPNTNRNERCPITGKPMRPVFEETVLGKYPVTYFFCKQSGLLKTETSYWLAEAYQTTIADTDIGLVRRNIANSRLLRPLLFHLFKGRGTFLDVAGGYGLLTRLLRDMGFDCYTTDPYCQNLFAKTFEPGKGFSADALFAFEVLEHVEDPCRFLGEIFEKFNCRTLIFSTHTFSGKIPPVNWWYYAFETGQHITFYQPRTLALLAKTFRLHYYAIDSATHIMTDRILTKRSQILFGNPFFRYLFSVYAGWHLTPERKSGADNQLINNKLKTTTRQDR